jgi:hypothetical protein
VFVTAARAVATTAMARVLAVIRVACRYPAKTSRLSKARVRRGNSGLVSGEGSELTEVAFVWQPVGQVPDGEVEAAGG